LAVAQLLAGSPLPNRFKEREQAKLRVIRWVSNRAMLKKKTYVENNQQGKMFHGYKRFSKAIIQNFPPNWITGFHEVSK